MAKKAVKNYLIDWENDNLVWGRGYYVTKVGRWYHQSLSGQLAPTGADAYKISNVITKKFGLKYRKVWIAYLTAERKGDGVKYDRKGKVIPKSPRWDFYGYIKAGKTKGTFRLRNLKHFNQSYLKRFGI
jgi:hypothetical protein